MRNVVQLCLAANNILLTRKRNHAFLFLTITFAWKKADHLASRRFSLKTNLVIESQVAQAHYESREQHYPT